MFHIPPQNLEASEQNLLKTVFICQKSSFTAPRFSTCKAIKHVKYNPYNTIESKQVPKSTVKITLPVEMWKGTRKQNKSKNTREK